MRGAVEANVLQAINISNGKLVWTLGALKGQATQDSDEYEDLGKLNPAITRYGRCLSEIGFRRFSIEEGRAWLRSAGCEPRLDAPRTLSELYAVIGGQSRETSNAKIGFRANGADSK